MKPGLYDGIPDTEYHAGPGISSSQIREASRPGGLAKLKWELEHPREDTSVFAFGRAVHTTILGEGTPVIPLPAEVGKTLTSVKARAFIKENPDKQVVTQSDYSTIMGMADALHRPENADALVLLTSKGKAEQSVYWEHDVTGTLCKCRPDWLPDADPNASEQWFIDYKTTANASPSKFRWSIRDYGYDQAAAWYADGLRAAGYHHNPVMMFIAQEKTPPYRTGVYSLNPSDIEHARERNLCALRDLEFALEFDFWPGYGVHELSL